jgi:outer membrane protein OmpA-like peptidoglycan-associated protein
MRPYCCHFILLFPLLLMTALATSQQRQRDTLILHFATDRYDFQPGDPQLDWLNSSLGGKKIDSVFITGYTDKTGTLSHNLHLSAQRAANAGSYLKHIFTARNNLRWRIAGAGVAPTPEQSDSANRRAEIVISYVTTASPIASPASATNHPPAADGPPAANPSSVAAPHLTTNTDTTQLIVVHTDSSSLAAATDSAKPTAVISLQNINFILDTPIPTAATQTRLPGYVSLLQQYKDRYLEIDGYVNSFVPLRGPKDPLFILSVKRAKYIYDLLIDAGFDPNRLTYKGMGNASPINPDPTTREEMNANMRVEIKVY